MFGGLTSLYVKGVQGFYTKMTGRQKIALINTIANYLIVTSLPEKVSHVTTTRLLADRNNIRQKLIKIRQFGAV
jgi:hypothetical protein